MIRHIVNVNVQGATAEQYYDFMIMPDDRCYHEWWPDEHLQYHIMKHGNEKHLGDEVYYDEYLGQKCRLRFHAIVSEAIRPVRIVWQMKKAGVRLPAFLILELHDSQSGIQIMHELRLGYSGCGRLLDPLIELYFNKSFQAALEKHCKNEWPRLAKYLSEGMVKEENLE